MPMASTASLRICPFLSALLFSCCSAWAGTIALPGVGGGLQIGVTSFKEARFQTVLKQQHDFSCGSAALASLLSYHYRDPVSEQHVFQSMYEHGNQQRIRRQGFSLLDMKKFLEARGYKADGFRVPLDTLPKKAGVPAIALIDTKGYRHFVLVKGVSEKEVLLGDPAMGLRVVPRSEFEKTWDGMLFLIRSHADIGRAHFNQAREWSANGQAPYGTAFTHQGLANFTLLLPHGQTY